MKIEQDPLPAPPSRSFLLAVLILLSFLTAVMTYPQVFHMRDGINDSGDPLQNLLARAGHRRSRHHERKLFSATGLRSRVRVHFASGPGKRRMEPARTKGRCPSRPTR